MQFQDRLLAQVVVSPGSTKKAPLKSDAFCPTLWAHLGSNQGPLDYESSALTS